MLKIVCYKSKSDESLYISDLQNLFSSTKLTNDQRNIHGVLALHKGTFFQVIEGEEAVIDTLYEAIKKDTRHSEIIEVLNEPINAPLFKDFSTGYAIVNNMEALYTLQQYTNFLGIDSKSNTNIFFEMITNLISEDA
ncbi:MAG: BLUF domain-containing protein [Bacteroidota bacterium]